MPADSEDVETHNDTALIAAGMAARPAGLAPVVGLGASAGGIEALGQFFGAMPADSGAAFVVVLHLSPDRESLLSEVLQRRTAMPVMEIEDGMTLRPDHVYVIAPSFEVTLEGEVIRLSRTDRNASHRHPVDTLFKSLAEQRAERGVAAVFSGMGTNGTQGLKEIKAAGGLILVQDPDTAQFSGMPRSAVAAGLADVVCSPAEMPEAVMRYLRHGYVQKPDGLEAAERERDLQRILDLLRARAGQEFTAYKSATLLRRINRRMSLKGLPTLEDYVGLLREDANEVGALVRDLLISVTSFFRDQEAWEALDTTVIQPMVAERETGATLRAWVAGCSSGEEAYSVAMLLIEAMEKSQKWLDVQVFACDVLEDSLAIARRGIYPSASVETLAPERIRRYFDRLDGSYQVKKTLRDRIIFARQDALHDPPFSRMDLVSCRNMLIYIEPKAQKRALAAFHFALRPGGRLFLGSAETIGRSDAMFETVSRRWRIYRRAETTGQAAELPLPGILSDGRRLLEGAGQDEPPTRLADVARRALLDRYAPASVLVDHRGRAVYFHGDTGDYLQQPGGELTRDLLAMAREGLTGKLRAAMQATAGKREETWFEAQARTPTGSTTVRVTVAPVSGAATRSPGMLLVTFTPGEKGEEDERAAEPIELSSSSAETELRSTRYELQDSVSQLQQANEELKASNEEVTSMNEELQSANEELETSKEELQSFNEELYSTNHQLQHKITELDEASDDLTNLLSGTEIATLFLDTDLRIKWFSPATKQLLDLVSSDVGRPIQHFAMKFADRALLADANRVLERLTPIEAEVRSDEDKWFLRRILPYRTRDNRIDGLAVTFTNITELRQAAQTIDEARIYAEAIVATVRQPLVVLDVDLRVRSANEAFYGLFGLAPERLQDRRLHEVGHGEWNLPGLRALLEEAQPRDHVAEDVEVEFGPEGPGQRTLLVNTRKLDRSGGREDLILLAIEDVTERKRALQHQEMLIGELNHRVKNVLATVQAITLQTLRQSPSMEEFNTAFMGRLLALARAHNLLVEKEWSGADVGQIVNEVLAPYRTEDADRVAVNGPPASVRPQVGVALMMILHELATNAAKYGALSAEDGRLSVWWEERRRTGNEARFELHWAESGGPPVRAPDRQGFGTRLIERSTEYELGGKARISYEPGGVVCELTFPVGGRRKE